MKKITCCDCGADLTEIGILVEGGIIARYNEDDDTFYYNEIDDIEVKCPECYNMCDIPEVYKRD